MDLTNITREVNETAGVIDSAVTFIQGVAAMIRQAGTDQAALEALATNLDTKANELAAAIAANSTPPTP